MIAKFRTLSLAVASATAILAVATPAEAGFGIRWGYVEVSSHSECISLLRGAVAYAGLRNQQFQANEVSGGAGAQQADGSSQVWSTMTCIREDSGRAFAVIMSVGDAQDSSVIAATRDTLTNYVDQNSQ